MDMLHEQRPEIIGDTIAIDEDSFFTETISFRSEEEARAGEKKQMAEDVVASSRRRCPRCPP